MIGANVPKHQLDQKHAYVGQVLDSMVTGHREQLGDLPPVDAWLAGGEAVIATACSLEGPEMVDGLITSLLSLAVARLAQRGGEGR